jgi:hypothetical protein
VPWAEEIYRNSYADGRVVVEMTVGHARFRVADEAPEAANFSPLTLGGTTVRINLLVADPDALAAPGGRQWRHSSRSGRRPRIWELRQNLGAYDAAYIALAEALGIELLTGDIKLKNAAWHRATVIVTR